MSPIIIISRTFYKRDNDIPPVSMKGQKKKEIKKKKRRIQKTRHACFFRSVV